MILVDPRTGSRELLSLFRRSGVPVALSDEEMPAGDFCFEGNGPDGRLLVGVERKTVRDMLDSIRTGRFSGTQLPILSMMYQRQYLILEGIYRANPEDGLLEEPRNGGWQPIVAGTTRYMGSMLDRFLISVEETSHIRVHRTSSRNETAQRIVNIWHFWNDKEYSQHRANTASPATHVEILKPWSLARRVAKEFPKIGVENSKAVASHFGSVLDMVNAEAEEWAELKLPCGPDKTRRLGDKTGKAIFDALRKQTG